MNKAEQIAEQIAASLNIAKIWNFLFNVKAAPYNARGDGNDDTNSIQKAINAAIAANSKSVFFPSGSYSATTLNDLDKVVLIGDNATLTLGGNDVKLEQYGEGTNIGETSLIYSKAIDEISVLPKDSLKRARKAISDTATLKIGFWGDSITEWGDVDFNDNYVQRVTSLLGQSLPGVTITTQNYALSSRRLSQAIDANYKGLASEPTDVSQGFWRSWSTVGKSWRDHVKDFAPDLLIVAFGMNDSGSAGTDETMFANLQSLDTFIKTWSVVPSVVVVPTFVPTKVVSRYGQRQDTTFAVARATREFTKQKGYIIADANRLHTILNFGRDEVSRAVSSETDFKYYGNSAKWSGDTSGFNMNGTTLSPKPGITGKMVKRVRDFYNGFIEFNMNPSVTGNSGLARIEYRANDLGKIIALIVPGNSGDGNVQLFADGTALASFSGLTIPTGSNTKVRIEVKDGTHKIYVNDVLRIDYTGVRKMHSGDILIGSDGTPPSFSSFTLGYRDGLQGAPLFNETELVGSYGQNKNGNGINHPTGLGHSLFYFPAFFGIITALARTNDVSLFLPKYIPTTAGTWNVSPGGAYPLTTTAGEKLFFCILPKYDKNRGIIFRNLTTFAYYQLSNTAVSQATLASLEVGKFAYYNSDATNDLLWISVPSTVSFPSELWTYQ